MNVLAALLLIFTCYEIYKFVNTEDLLPLYDLVSQYSRSKNLSEKVFILKSLSSSQHIYLLFALDLLYSLFCVILLFTPFWYIGALILSFSIVKSILYKTKINKIVVWKMDAIFSIIVLSILLVFIKFTI